MRIKIYIFFSFFVLYQINVFSQSTLTGTVKDSLNHPLANANVIAEPLDSLQKIKFAITGEDGKYSLKLENIRYSVTASYMGFESFSFDIKASGAAISRDIVLNPKAEGLEEVVIEMPVVVKEDTIVYNIEKLVTGEERKLKDVLKKLPGVEVDRDGTIRVRGKEVTVMLVENKKFFGGGSKLAVDNIPADAIDQIEVLDNYNEVAFLKNVSDSEDMAMNVKLKEDMKNFAFGDIEIGKGNRDFYRAHSNLFYYSPKSNVNFIGNLNNIREQVFTYEQYFNFTSGLNSVFNQGNTNFDSSNDDFLQFLESADVVESQRQFGALNISQEVNNKLNISAYGIFSRTKEQTLVQAINRYNTFTEISEGSSATDNLLGIGHIKAVFMPNLTDQWYLRTQFKKTDNGYHNRITSEVDTLNNLFLSQQDVAGSFFNQSVEWHRKSSRKHTFSFAANYTFEERAPETFWETSDPILQGLIPVVEQSVFRLHQSKRVKNNQLDAIFKHYWVLDKNNHIYSTLGNTYLNQQFFTRDFQELEDGNINDFSSGNFGNDLDFSLNDLFLGLHYKFQLGIFSFDQGAFLHHYQWKIQQENDLFRSKTLVLPGFSAEAKFSQTKQLNFDYELKSSFSEASGFANNYYLRSYNAVFRGNQNLENELSHNFRLRYNKFSTYRGVRWYAAANYIQQTKGVKNAILYEGINRSIMPVLLDNPETRWSFFGNAKKKIKDINFGIGIQHYFSRYIQPVNDILEKSKSRNWSYDLSAKTLYDNFPIIEIGFRQNIGRYSLSGQESEFMTTEPFLNIDYDFLKGFIASFDYSSYTYRNKSLNLRNSYQMANASLYYKKESSAWSFELEARNLFDVQFKNRNSFSTYVISDIRTYILPQIIMFSIGYNL